MRSRKVILPEGVQDLLIDDCIYKRHIENNLMDSFIHSGYMEVSSPTLEYYDLFMKDYIIENGDKMYKLIDSHGSILVLRPDCTIPIARIVATKMKDFVYPLKLCYIQNVFRIDQEQAGKKREYRQAGIELFGINSCQADAEVLMTAIESLQNLGLENFQIDIGQVKLLNGVLRHIKAAEIKEEVIELIENKSFVQLNKLADSLDMDPGMRTILKEIPRLFGDPQEVFEELQKLPLNNEMKEAADELEKVCSLIGQYGLGQYLSLDLGMVTRIEYYTGLIFKGFTKDLGEVLFSGGRYDKLLENFGMNCPATGFAFIINRITKALKIQQNIKVNRPEHYLFIDYEGLEKQAAAAQKKLRNEGCIAEYCLLADEEKISEYARRRKADFIVRVDKDGVMAIVQDLGRQ